MDDFIFRYTFRFKDQFLRCLPKIRKGKDLDYLIISRSYRSLYMVRGTWQSTKVVRYCRAPIERELTMDQQTVLTFLKDNKAYFRQEFGVQRIGLFGSFAANRETSKSDIDLFIEVPKEQKNWDAFLLMKEYLKHGLNREIDLVFLDPMNPLVKIQAMQEVIYA